MSQVYWMFELKVREGQEAELDALVADMVTATEANEPGTMHYDWSRSEDGTAVHIYEHFEDADACMVHLKNFGAFMKRFFGTLTPTRYTIYGAPDDRVREALAQMKPTYMEPMKGFHR